MSSKGDGPKFTSSNGSTGGIFFSDSTNPIIKIKQNKNKNKFTKKFKKYKNYQQFHQKKFF